MNSCTALNALVIAAGYEPLRKYSGRMMFGRDCPGFTTTDSGILVGYKLGEAYSTLTQEQQNAVMDIKEHILASKSEGLGYETIFYFPSMEWEPPEEDDEEPLDEHG